MRRSERRFQERKKIETLNLGKHLLTPNQKVVIREFERKGNGESVKLNRDDEKETVGAEPSPRLLFTAVTVHHATVHHGYCSPPLLFITVMAEITEIVNPIGDRSQTAGELQNVHSAYRLNGKNYLKWSQLIRTILKGKGKVSHLTDIAPDEQDAKFKSWDEEDSMIMAWLWNSMVPEISDTCMFLKSSKKIWEAVEQTYSKGNKSVTEYANQLKSLWMELDHYRVIKAKCSEDSAILKEYIEQDRVYDFLVGLNPEYDQVRIQILGKEKVPGLNEVVAIIRSEESRRGLMLETPTTESSAMKAEGGTTMITNQKKSGFSNIEKKQEEVWCTYCNKPRHTREKCWKLHGKPPSREWGQKGGPPKREGQRQAHIVNGQGEESVQLNHEEIERVRSFLSKLEKPSDTPFTHFWILDSGAIDHMTPLPKYFSTYFPCPSNKKISTADGTCITAAGAKWFLTFIDDCTRVAWVFLLKHKYEVSSIFVQFVFMIKNQFGVNIKRIRSDNAKDYFNLVLNSFCQKEGIIHESSCVNTPQQNGIAERKNGHLLDQTRALFLQNHVPKKFWGEDLLTATYLINRLPSKILASKSPMEVLSSFYPHLNPTNKLQPGIFGRVSFVHVHSNERGKLDPRAVKCVFLGYSTTQKGYKCFHPPSKRFFVSRDVTFNEQESYF
ncbi:uncharacterized protein [Phaseolus vulgaris]|uniref:uncharacterized protein n=1 Tax=Phaseolus vulgaris TaxID=3885 RepID=UPI0035C9F447